MNEYTAFVESQLTGETDVFGETFPSDTLPTTDPHNGATIESVLFAVVAAASPRPM